MITEPNPTLLIGQSGGATAVINASLVGVVKAARESGEYSRILGLANGIQGLLNHQFFDLTELSDDDLERIARTPSAALGTGRTRLKDSDLSQTLLAMQSLGVTSFVYIGGNDSADTSLRLGQYAQRIGYGLRVMSVPKTIDNDLRETWFCPGYPSIARYMANAARDAVYDTIASPQLYPVKFIEVMGRDAGWLAATTTLAFGPGERDLQPVLLLPEHRYASVKDVLDIIRADVDKRGFSVVVVPETLRTSGDRHFGGEEPEYVDGFGHQYFPSTGAALTRAVATQLNLRARYEKPGTAARMAMASVSAVDLQIARDLGRAAVQAIAQGVSGHMTRVERTAEGGWAISAVPLDAVANKVRPLEAAFIGDDGRSVTEAYREYMAPLLGDPPFLPYVRLGAPIEITGEDIPSIPGLALDPDDSVIDDEFDDPDDFLEIEADHEGHVIDATGAEIPLTVGQDVIGSCGNKIGDIVDVRDDYLVVEKGFFLPEDVYVPLTAVDHGDPHQVVLNVSREASERAGWDHDPRDDDDVDDDES